MYQQSYQYNSDVLELPESNTKFRELEQRVEKVLETYSNVHRGAGHFSMLTTQLYEHARGIVLDYLKLSKEEYKLVFCTSYGAELLQKQIYYKNYKRITSNELGLPLGVTALAIRKRAIHRGIPFYTGGSTVKIVSPNSLIWADYPQRFEAGTPAIVNAITFAVALQILQNKGLKKFSTEVSNVFSAEQLFYLDELSGFTGNSMLIELRKLLIGKNVQVPTDEGLQPFINFDNAASTPTFTPVWNVVKSVMKIPVEMHHLIIRETEKIIFNFLNADNRIHDIAFTGNATESINIAAKLLKNEFYDEEFVVVTTLLEHNSNELPWRFMPGVTVVHLDVDSNGFLSLNELKQLLLNYNVNQIFGKKRIRLLAVSGASNVLGSYNDLKKIGKMVHRYGAKLFVDGAQLVAHRKTNLDEIDADYFVFSGHKIYAPFGSGVLLFKKNDFKKSASELTKIKQAGSENVIGIAAMGKSIHLIQRIGMDVVEQKEQDLTRQLLNYLSVKNELEVSGITKTDEQGIKDKGGIISFSIKKVPHNLVARELAEKGGIGVRNGCFCSHLLVKKLLKIHPYRALAADFALILLPSYTSAVLPGLVRVSFGIQNEDSEVAKFAWTLEKILQMPRSKIVQNAASTYNGVYKLPKTKTSEAMSLFVEERIRSVFG